MRHDDRKAPLPIQRRKIYPTEDRARAAHDRDFANLLEKFLPDALVPKLRLDEKILNKAMLCPLLLENFERDEAVLAVNTLRAFALRDILRVKRRQIVA